jgi:hypothetical protein
MPALRRVLAVLAAVVAGILLVSGSSVLFTASAFSAYPGMKAVPWIVFGVCGGAAAVAFLVAAALRGFRHAGPWAAALLLSVAAVNAFMALSFFCMLHSPEMLHAVAAASAPGAASFDQVVGSPGAGLEATAGIALAGLALLWRFRSRPPTV